MEQVAFPVNLFGKIYTKLQSCMVASFENLINWYPEAKNAQRGLQPQISPLDLPAIEVPGQPLCFVFGLLASKCWSFRWES